jgi:hypothetical protein
MPDYRRNRVPGGTFFSTVNLSDRRSRRIDIVRDTLRRVRLPALVGLAFSTALGFAMPSRGADLTTAVQKAFDAFCGLNLRYIEALFDATRTTCRITSYRDGLIILFTAEQPVFRIPAARKAWAMVAVATAGKTIRDLGGNLIGVDYVGLTDSEQAKSGKVARLPASFAEELQAAVHDGRIDAGVAVENLDRRLRLEP